MRRHEALVVDLLTRLAAAENSLESLRRTCRGYLFELEQLEQTEGVIGASAMIDSIESRIDGFNVDR